MSRDKLKFRGLAANGTESTILKLIRDYEPIARTRIAALGSLPQAAVSCAVAKLLTGKILTESLGADESGPRKKRGLRLNPSAGYALSVEYGPQGIEGAVVDFAYETVSTLTEERPLALVSKQKKIQTILDFVRRLQKAAPTDGRKCLGLAVVDPGLIDPIQGQTLMSTTMADWESVPIVRTFQEQLHLPVLLLNSSTAKIRAIDQVEVQGRVSNLLYIEYGDGIGCGLKLAGNYIPGQHSSAGELGHLRVADQTIPCRCGSAGCLEAVAALPALARNAKEALTENSNSCLARLKEITGINVLEAVSKGDRLASRIVDEAFEYLGRGIAGAIHIVDPEIVLLDNRLETAGNEAAESLIRSVTKNVSVFHSNHLQLRVSKMKSHIGALGGAAIVLDRCLTA